MQKSNNKIISSRLSICLVTYSGCPCADTPGFFFSFILLLNACRLYEQGAKIYLILGDILFKTPKNLILGIYFAEADTKKHRYASAKTSNTAQAKRTD